MTADTQASLPAEPGEQDRKPAIGRRLRRLREARGIPRRALAEKLGVDVSAVAAWERGLYLPRMEHRLALAEALHADLGDLFMGDSAQDEAAAGRARIVDTYDDLPDMLMRALSKCRKLKALRMAAPYATAAYVQQEFRAQIGERLVQRTLEVERIEVFYRLDRLREAVSNAFRYDGCDYRLRGFAADGDVMPGMGFYSFDDGEFFLGAYWSSVPPVGQPNLRLAGEPFRTYFAAYWAEIWRRGAWLNARGAHDLSRFRELALRLGLAEEEWPAFVEEARSISIGDGAPPLP